MFAPTNHQAEEPFICHQSNCTSKGARGVGKVAKYTLQYRPPTNPATPRHAPGRPTTPYHNTSHQFYHAFVLQLAAAIFKRYREADCYKRRQPGRSVPGTIDVTECCSRPGFHIVALFAQYSPGKPKNGGNDNRAQRLRWFREALDAFATECLSQRSGPHRVGMPYNIGCALAGGHWPDYYKVIAREALHGRASHVHLRITNPKPPLTLAAITPPGDRGMGRGQ